MYHPLHLLLYRTLSLEWAFNLEFILSYVWMFPGMYLMLRRLDLPQYASLFGALVFTFSGFNLLHSVHLNAIAVISHIPWLIVAIDIVLRTTDRRKLAAAQLSISLLTGSELLLGQPQYVWFSALAEGLFVLWRLKDSVSWWRILMLVLAKLVGGMLGAVQLLPTMDVLSQSVRINPSLEFVLRFSLHPVNLVQLWSPFALEGRTLDKFKQEAVLYNGAFCTLALVWLFVRRHSLGRWRSLVVATSCLRRGDADRGAWEIWRRIRVDRYTAARRCFAGAGALRHSCAFGHGDSRRCCVHGPYRVTATPRASAVARFVAFRGACECSVLQRRSRPLGYGATRQITHWVKHLASVQAFSDRAGADTA